MEGIIEDQISLINYKGKLYLKRSYMSRISKVKRLKGIKSIRAHCIYEGDEFQQQYNIETAALEICKFNPKFENIDVNKIKGAFAVIIGEEGIIHTEIMNIGQIENEWQKGLEKPIEAANEILTDDIAKNIVINRACKVFIHSSSESSKHGDSKFDKKGIKQVDKKDTVELKEKDATEENSYDINGTGIQGNVSDKEALEKSDKAASRSTEGPDF